MISTAKALYDFFSGFGIAAYAADTVPDDAELPYLTYPQQEPEWSKKATFYVSVYYRSKTSNLSALTKADEIAQAIGNGVKIHCDGGYVFIWPENPLIQTIPQNGDVRGAYINLSINAYHTPGV